MTSHFKPLKPDDDLHWLAARYALGELAEDARDAFEARLANDQEAREAVAGAVAVLSAVCASGQLQCTGPTGNSRVAGAWLSRSIWLAGIAAAIAIAAFWGISTNWNRQDSMANLATAWSDARDSVAEDVHEEVALAAEPGAASLEDVDVPDWLITAVSLRADEVAPESKGSNQPDSGEGA
jgi:anti-sigma-K factor RskA